MIRPMSQFVFLAYMAVLKKTVNLTLAAVLFILTAIVKLLLVFVLHICLAKLKSTRRMTRVCRARFEQDDILEAEVVCRTGAIGVEHPEETNNQNKPLTSKEDAKDAESRISSRFRAWRLPRWTRFSYTTDPGRMRPTQRRQPIPFHYRERSVSKVDSTSPPAALRSPTLQEHQAGTSGTTSLVTRHPPHPIWDDEPRHDIPYDNPYYARPITNTLWLPRNIFGVLNLDDTVELRHSLTSESSNEDLGLEVAHDIASLYDSPTRSPDVERGSVFPVIPNQYSGEEDIDLPEGIRNRVMAMDRNEEIDSVDEHRPSLFRQRFSSNGTSGQSSALRIPRGITTRSQTVDEHPRTQSQTFEPSGEPLRQRAMTLTGHQQDSPTQVYTKSDPVLRPDLHAQAELIRSTASIIPRGSRISIAGNVPTGEAVLNEAIAEEQIAAEERLKKEEAEAIQHNRRLAPAWVASWFYAKVHTSSS